MSKLFIKNDSEENLGFVIKPSLSDPNSVKDIIVSESNTIIQGDGFISACLTAEDTIPHGGSPNSDVAEINGPVVVEINGELIPYIIQAENLSTYFNSNPDYNLKFEKQMDYQISCDGATSSATVYADNWTETYGKVTVNGVTYDNIRIGDNIGGAIQAFKAFAEADGLGSDFEHLEGAYSSSSDNTVYNFDPNNVFRVLMEVETGDTLMFEVSDNNDNPTLVVDPDQGIISFCLAKYTGG